MAEPAPPARDKSSGSVLIPAGATQAAVALARLAAPHESETGMPLCFVLAPLAS